MIREVEFMSQARAEHFKPLAREAIISITGSGFPGAKLRKGWTRVLRMVFDDVERPGYGAIPFDTDHAEVILGWLDAVQDKVDRIFVHCHAGKNRSAAVAKFIAETYDLPGGVRVYEDGNRRVHRLLCIQWRTRMNRVSVGGTHSPFRVEKKYGRPYEAQEGVRDEQRNP